jgi:hypothetical protein
VSRHTFETADGQHLVTVGWDPPLQTYFGQVHLRLDRIPCDDPECVEHFGSHARSECREPEPLVWVGLDLHELYDLDSLARALGRWWDAVPVAATVQLDRDRDEDRA